MHDKTGSIPTSFNYHSFREKHKAQKDAGVILADALKIGLNPLLATSTLASVLTYQGNLDAYALIEKSMPADLKAFHAKIGVYADQIKAEASGIKAKDAYDINDLFCVVCKDQSKAKSQFDSKSAYSSERGIFIMDNIYYENIPQTIQGYISLAFRGIAKLHLRENGKPIV